MFTIDPDGTVKVYHAGGAADPEDSGAYVHSESELSALIQSKPGEWAVKLWNQLPGVVPITTPKFRNKPTAVERIWKKLAELYPDAIVAEEMPKAKGKRGASSHKNTVPALAVETKHKTVRHSLGKKRSSWAEELTGELRKRFKSGQDFTLPDVYKLIPAFQRRHPNNKNIGACLRRTLAQDLRGKGIVKSAKKGTYIMRAA